jgi:hypothetical protein
MADCVVLLGRCGENDKAAVSLATAAWNECFVTDFTD